MRRRLMRVPLLNRYPDVSPDSPAECHPMDGSRGRRNMVAAIALLIAAGCAGCAGGHDSPPASAAGAPAAECGQTTARQDTARQTRAMWITTVNNGDWPDKAGLPV